MQGRRFFSHAILGLLTLAFALVLPASPAQAAVQGPYVIRGWASHRCIDVPNGSSENYERLIIYSCGDNQNLNQLWYFIDTDSGYYNIKNIMTGKCITVLNASTSNNAEIVQYTCGTGDNEEWRTVFVQENWNEGYIDYYVVINRKSGRCLTVKNASVNNGAELLQYDCNYGDNQLWTWQTY